MFDRTINKSLIMNSNTYSMLKMESLKIAWTYSVWNMKKQMTVADLVSVGLYLFKANNGCIGTTFLGCYFIVFIADFEQLFGQC